jgi:hypothetical protein
MVGTAAVSLGTALSLGLAALPLVAVTGPASAGVTVGVASGAEAASTGCPATVEAQLLSDATSRPVAAHSRRNRRTAATPSPDMPG